MTVGGAYLDDGWPRAAFVLAFLRMSVGDLCLAFDSLTADKLRSRAWRQAGGIFGVVMLPAPGASPAFQACGG